MKFSPLKRNIVLLLIRDTESADLIDNIKMYLSVTSEQAFYIIDYLLEQKWIFFVDGKLMLTDSGYSLLRQAKLEKFFLDNIYERKFKINQNYLRNYIPKSF
ncbi:hypothetical protein COL82_09570 [Bacillus toyonensis]|uniref:hypothetical protein n=1 Tax=Bacillus toyonensis TaxID=155322 RepID=UPI000BF77698|nr:hypothetical protein [Bacillus toyonensis]PFZ78742.1 hypothetical protein COL82_09570 [Bacillus toyonensis]